MSSDAFFIFGIIMPAQPASKVWLQILIFLFGSLAKERRLKEREEKRLEEKRIKEAQQKRERQEQSTSSKYQHHIKSTAKGLEDWPR